MCATCFAQGSQRNSGFHSCKTEDWKRISAPCVYWLGIVKVTRTARNSVIILPPFVVDRVINTFTLANSGKIGAGYWMVVLGVAAMLRRSCFLSDPPIYAQSVSEGNPSLESKTGGNKAKLCWGIGCATQSHFFKILRLKALLGSKFSSYVKSGWKPISKWTWSDSPENSISWHLVRM